MGRDRPDARHRGFPPGPAARAWPDLHEVITSSYGAKIIGGRLGPRRELTITLELWPRCAGELMPTWHSGTGPVVQVRFGGISNIDEVSAILAPLLDDCEHIDGLNYLRIAKDVATPPHVLCLEMGFDRSGASIQIVCRTVAVTSGSATVVDHQANE